MTISSTTNRVTYAGNGATVDFAVAFPFHATTDLVILETVIATGVQTVKTITTHYTVAGSADAQGHYPNGGTVTAVTAPASTVTWTIYRDPPLTQAVDLVENDPLPVEAAVESPLDKLTMLAQRSRELSTRALRQPEGDTADIEYLPSKVDRASMYLAFDADGDPVAVAGSENAFVVSTFAETLLDDTTAAAMRATLMAGLFTTRGDLMRAGAAAVPERVALGASGTLLTSNGTDAVWAAVPADSVDKTQLVDDYANSWVFIQKQSPAAVAACDFTLPAGYDRFRLDIIKAAPASDGVEPRIRLSDDSGVSFEADASDYSYTSTGGVSSTLEQAADTSYAILGSGVVGNATGEYVSGTLTIDGALDAVSTVMSFVGGWQNTSSVTLNATSAGSLVADAATQAVRFFFASGNIASGTLILYGLRTDQS